jgi:hypothetical protein
LNVAWLSDEEDGGRNKEKFSKELSLVVKFCQKKKFRSKIGILGPGRILSYEQRKNRICIATLNFNMNIFIDFVLTKIKITIDRKST